MRLNPILMLLLTVTVLAGPASAGDVFKVNTSIKPPLSTEAEDGFLDLIIKELGIRTGIKAKLVRQPPERALVSANQGLSDMELPRIAGLEKRYTNLVMVPEKVLDYNFVAFAKGKLEITSWEDLAGLRVGYLIGWKIYEKNVPHTAAITKLKKPAQLMAMLSNNRIDVALYESYAGWHLARQYGLMPVVECKPPLNIKPMYMYVHKSSAYLVPLLTESLKEMKADGTYQRIAEQPPKNKQKRPASRKRAFAVY